MTLAHRNRSDFCDLRLRCPSRTPENRAISETQETAMMHCDLRVRWKVASDLRFRAAISEPKTPSFCRISGDLAPSTRKSLAIAIVRFWCAKGVTQKKKLRTAPVLSAHHQPLSGAGCNTQGTICHGLDGPIRASIRANRLILANHVRVPELNPLFANRASKGAKTCESQV